MAYLLKEDMKKLTTKRLLAYKKKQLNIPVNDSSWWRECDHECEHVKCKKIKDQQRCLTEIKQILASREHIVKYNNTIRDEWNKTDHFCDCCGDKLKKDLVMDRCNKCIKDIRESDCTSIEEFKHTKGYK